MSGLTVAEELVLVALNGETGAGRMRPGLDWAVAGAVIVELVLTRRLIVGDDDFLAVLDSTPTGIAHVDATLATVSGRGGPMKVGKALRRTRSSARDHTIATLVERGVLGVERTRVLGVIPLSRYPEQAVAAGTEVRDRLAGVVLKGLEPDERTAALIGILHAGNHWRKVLSDGSRQRIKRRMADIASGQAVSPAVRKAIVRTRAAVIAMAAAASNNG
ncbi:GPP34 family phosphoprotein [Saccharomonospora sp. NPDC006951]